ncbi:MAG: 50S ribosomal protein L4 [Candidatus Edwardsbacteria bacterium]
MTIETSLYTITGEEKGTVELPTEIFGVKPNEHAVWAAVRMYQANLRQGTASTKTRTTISGGGKKPWIQKGTGQARAGSRRSPLWVGGAITHGPHPRDYSYSIPKKVRHLALCSVISDRQKKNNLLILEELKIDEPKTRKMIEILEQLNLTGKKSLFLVNKIDENLKRASRNIPKIEIKRAQDVNVYDVLLYDKLIMTKSAVESLKEVLCLERPKRNH